MQAHAPAQECPSFAEREKGGFRAVSSMNTFSSHSREDRPYAAADPPAQRRPARRPARATQSA